MTRKDYILIADTIRRHAESKTTESVAWWLADTLEKENKMFDRVRFVAACKPGGK